MDAETDKVIAGLIENKPGSRAEAAKELYRLCAENAELRTLVKRLQHYEAQIAALALGDKQLLKDAERMHWAEQNSKDMGTHWEIRTGSQVGGLRDAIDAAIKEQT